MNQLHTRYQLTLPSNGTSFTGFVKLQLTDNSPFTFFMDRDIDLAIADPATPNSPLVISKDPVRSPCAGITHRAIFQTLSVTTLQMRSGPSTAAQYRLFMEPGY